MNDYFVAFWNVENLFDVDGSPDRPAWLQKTLARELRGWDETILSRKVAQLARIISQMNEGQGPDVLGVCEAENRPVLERLRQSLEPLGRNYDLAHHDTQDKRGIDIAFIYDSDVLVAREQFDHVVLLRNATRDLFQVNFMTHNDNLIVLVGNHWPARRGGQFQSEPYRIIAAETLSYWNERIMEIQGENTAIINMGDFNDEPFNRSVHEYALAINEVTRVKNALGPRLFNLMWPFLGDGLGTHYFDNLPNVLDQFLISRGLVNGKGEFQVKEDSVKIQMFPEMVADGAYPVPIRFGRPAADLNLDGFSDHYPISMIVQEKP